MNNEHLIGLLCSLVLLFPLLGSAWNGLVGPVAGRRWVNLVGTASIGAAFLVAFTLLANVMTAPEGEKSLTVSLWQWLNLGPIVNAGQDVAINVDFTIDPLSVLMLMVITGVGFLIHIYSVGYMEHDEDVARFFAYMNFFIFSMVLLVLSADLAILIVGWALVALSSYLLIGFWYQRPSAVVASRKAFITQVIGDVALVLAAFMIVTRLGTLSMPLILANAGEFGHGSAYVTGICVLLAIGAFAKSAQFPLHTWLPDAMEGPTPVSALIHAATMVTAGVYLIARFGPLFGQSPTAQAIVACVGMGTAVMAGIIALSQVDIKRVIAYSTMSQIGLMISAVGLGAYSVGMFHFMTHAIFKALLFMAAGNVIHSLHDEQDIRLMGGLHPRMRWTALWFICGSFALAGAPPFAGWWSKEAMLGFAANAPGALIALFFVGLIVNVLTGIYAFRLYFTVFRGEPQTAKVYAAHEAPKVMLIPVGILGCGAVIAGLIESPVPSFIGNHLWQGISTFLEPVVGHGNEPSEAVAWMALAAGTICSVAGIGAAYSWWEKNRGRASRIAGRLPRLMPVLSFHKFYFDELYDAILVRPVTAFSRAMRRVVEPRGMDGWVRGTAAMFDDLGVGIAERQSGLIRDYATYMLAFAVIGILFVLGLWAK